MAKKAKAKKKSSATPKSIKATVAEIVAQIITHFGAGYGAQRQSEGATTPANGQIYQKPSDLGKFHRRLAESVNRNFNIIKWNTDPGGRSQISKAAFDHGVLARKAVVAAGGTTVTYAQIIKTLRDIQRAQCPGTTKSGGGPACDF